MQAGFDNIHQSEAIEGALPRDQNSPRPAPFGLYAEQVNANGFAVARDINRRSWLYRIRPAAQQRAFEPLEHATFTNRYGHRHPEINLRGWQPQPLPKEPTDFVDGIASMGGAGSPRMRRGYAIHVYAANRNMEDRAFYNADGELVLLPQHGRLLIHTELGVIQVAPGQLLLIPRGLRFCVQLMDGVGRGFIGEVFGRQFRLPDRGLVGANGLADARHFFAPVAAFEDRRAAGYRITAKLGGALYEATQDYSPFDVVAWHGNYAPYLYDLSHFSPVGATAFDHPDPSIYTVLSAPLDEHGANAMDLVVFPERWDVSRHTFRPPFFHRNTTTEFNGVLREPKRDDQPFAAGSCFLTPAMTPHGVLASSSERAFAAEGEEADKPVHLSARSLWFQFESALPMTLSSWALDAEHRVRQWRDVWGEYPSHFEGPGEDLRT